MVGHILKTKVLSPFLLVSRDGEEIEADHKSFIPSAFIKHLPGARYSHWIGKIVDKTGQAWTLFTRNIYSSGNDRQ